MSAGWSTAAAARPSNADFYGLQTSGMLENPSSAPDETMAMKSLGIHTVRIAIYWDKVQKGDGTCSGGAIGPIDWKPLDDIFLKAAEDGITVIPDLGSRRQPSSASGPCSGYQTPGAEYDDWYKPGGFVTQLVQHYGVGGSFWGNHSVYASHAVRVWEVGNEENYTLFAPNGSVNPKGYAKYLIDTSKAIKDVRADATVLIGGLAPSGWDGVMPMAEFLDKMYEGQPGVYGAEALDASFDGVGIHPYSLTDHHGYEVHAKEVLSRVESARKTLNEDGHIDTDKTLWVTEVGWPVGSGFSFPYSETPTQQAHDLWQTFTLLSKEADDNKVKYLGWYLFQDRSCGSSCAWPDLAGLRDASRNIRASWCAYSHLTGAFACPYVPQEGFETVTYATASSPLNGQPGYISVSGNVYVTNIEGEPVTNLVANINFSKLEGGRWVFKNTAQVTIINGHYEVNNWTVGSGQWRTRTVFPQQGNFNQSEANYHEFQVKPGYHLVARHSGKCLSLSENNPSNGAAIIQWACSPSPSPGDGQVITLVPMGGSRYNVKVNSSGKCVDVTGVSTADGAYLQQWDCLGPSQTNQIWNKVQIEGQSGYFAFIAQHSSKCMDVAGVSTGNGARIQQWTCYWSGNQQWKVQAIN
jgi:hypothetical protein